MSEPRYLIVHGHFYQPPRESPWTGLISPESGAAPYANWNERILAECYVANADARVEDGKLVRLRDNYERLNFDCGPTLMRWLERHGQHAYRAMLRADRTSCAAHHGHGNAIAQGYNHSILPLLAPHDRELQIAWGLAEFRLRFGREAEGLWLPECAADDETLAAVAQAGVKFVILGSDQGRFSGAAAASRASGPFAWRGNDERLAIFRFDRELSAAISSGEGLADAESLVKAMLELSPGAALLLASDGEYFGHHRRAGAGELARMLAIVEQHADLALINCAAYLAAHPAQGGFAMPTASSWSCPHGIERWRADCGCRLNAQLGQGWRAPLRAAMEFICAHCQVIYARCAAPLVKDPQAALKDSVSLVIDSAPAAADRFFARHRVSDPAAQQQLTTLFEMQHAAQTTLTSCAWFFDDFGGPEGRVALRWAARAVELAALFAPSIEVELLERLRLIRSDRREIGDAASLYLSLKTRESRGRI
jgi:Domain of unknown function (DUF3536)/Glycosyl hydrolase family 57